MLNYKAINYFHQIKLKKKKIEETKMNEINLPNAYLTRRIRRTASSKRDLGIEPSLTHSRVRL